MKYIIDKVEDLGLMKETKLSQIKKLKSLRYSDTQQNLSFLRSLSPNKTHKKPYKLFWNVRCSFKIVENLTTNRSYIYDTYKTLYSNIDTLGKMTLFPNLFGDVDLFVNLNAYISNLNKSVKNIEKEIRHLKNSLRKSKKW